MDLARRPPHGRTRRTKHATSLGLALALSSLASGCAHAPPMHCERMAEMPGTEDLDLLPPRGPSAVLVSSTDRRDEAEGDGSLWVVHVDTGATEPLELLGRDACSFRPHGLSTVQRHDGRWEVYVVTHLRPQDASEPGCAIDRELDPLPPRLDAIERFTVEDDGLRFVERLSDPLMTHLNDVDADADGRLWVSNNPPWLESRALVADLVLGRRRGQVLLWRPAERQWSVAARRMLFPNGVAIDPSGQHLFVAGARGWVRHFALDGVGEAEGRPVRRTRARGTLDNLMWGDDGTLWTASHPNGLAFIRHTKDAAAISPTEVFRVGPGGRRGQRLKAERVHRADDGTINAGSVAQPLGDAIVVGRVFDPGIDVCRP